ncbi:Transcriptional regulator PadR-like family protein [compost metagenome]
MKIQGVILGILNSGPHSGYEIKRQFEERFSFFFNASYGSIYPTLSKLEKDNLITKITVRQDGKPNKHVYTISESGIDLFNEYLNAPMELDMFLSDFLTHLYFGDMASQESMETLLRQGLKGIQELRDKLNEQYKHFENSSLTFQKSCIELGLTHYDSFIKKIDSMLIAVERKE